MAPILGAARQTLSKYCCSTTEYTQRRLEQLWGAFPGPQRASPLSSEVWDGSSLYVNGVALSFLSGSSARLSLHQVARSPCRQWKVQHTEVGGAGRRRWARLVRWH